MSDPKPARSGSTKGPSTAARYTFMLLLGLVIGVVATVMLLRAIDSGKTWQDRYPHAAMQMMQAHVAQLNGDLDANRCTSTDSLPHLQALRVVANDLEPAFPGLADDRRFNDHASQLRAKLDRALAAPPGSCEATAEIAKQLGESCKGCHQDFRS